MMPDPVNSVGLGRAVAVNSGARPRVLMFCPQFAPAIGGAERQAEKLGKELRAQGIDVRILTPRLDKMSAAVECIDGVLPVRRFVLSDLSKRFPWLRGIGLLNAPWVSLQVFWQVWREGGNADIVHCHIGSLQTVAAAFASRVRGLPVICKAAMADERGDLGEAARLGLTGRLVAKLGRTAFTKWIATTRAVREALLRAGVDDSRILMIPNGVEVCGEALSRPSVAVRRFLYLGRLSTNIDRDVPGMIKAFDAVADGLADVELAIVGGGDLLEETRVLALASRNSPRIKVLGPMSPNEWLAWAHCLVLPSRREGLSNALLEAMAVGLPCIANDIPPNREVLGGGEFGMLVPVADVEQLQAAMLRCATDAPYAVGLAAKAKVRVAERYSLGAVAKKYCDLYEALMRCGSAPRVDA